MSTYVTTIFTFLGGMVCTESGDPVAGRIVLWLNATKIFTSAVSQTLRCSVQGTSIPETLSVLGTSLRLSKAEVSDELG